RPRALRHARRLRPQGPAHLQGALRQAPRGLRGDQAPPARARRRRFARPPSAPSLPANRRHRRLPLAPVRPLQQARLIPFPLDPSMPPPPMPPSSSPMSQPAPPQIPPGVARLALNRPEARNALSVDLLDALHARIDEVALASRTGASPLSTLVLTG